MPYVTTFDRCLPSRVKQFVETHPSACDKTIAQELQKIYRKDYGRRKRNSFRVLVSEVHKSLCNSGELQNQVTRGNTPKTSKRFKTQCKVNRSSSDSSSVDDDDEVADYPDTNIMNRSLSSLYSRRSGTSLSSSVMKSSPLRGPYFYEAAEGGMDHSGKNDNRSATSKDPASMLLCPEDDTLAQPLKNTKLEANISDNENILDESHALQTGDEPGKAMPTLTPVLSTSVSHSVKKQSVKKKTRKENNRSHTRKKKQNNTEDNKDDFVPPQRSFELKSSDVTFADFAGNDAALNELSRLLLHMKHPEIYKTLGASPPRGVLLHGPPGCGKTLLGRTIAGQLDVPLLQLAGPELVAGVSGESERRVRDLFDAAVRGAPCVLFLDEIETIAQRRENSSKEMERRIVAQLLTCMDSLNRTGEPVFVVGATNRPESLDSALRRAGRFDREIALGIPDERSRIQILKVLCRNLKLSDDVNFQLIARLTPGYVGADLMSLCREAVMQAVNRFLRYSSALSATANSPLTDTLAFLKNPLPLTAECLQGVFIETKDFELAVHDVQPSAKREGFATVPDTTWDDIGALESVREELSMAILGPVRNPGAFSALGLSRASGILLAGPPGCGKTLLAKAIANESGINFVSVKGPELLNMYVGESERAVRQCFERARNSSPCVIFFDELDALCPHRTSAESGASARVVNQMLTELDGLEARKQVFVIAATNRRDIIDPAILRPGRLDKTLYIGIPSANDRVKILRTITRNGTKPVLTDDVCLDRLGRDDRCEGFTGADLSALIREAALSALRETMQHSWTVILPDEKVSESKVAVSMKNIESALLKVQPSISVKDRLKYEELRKLSSVCS